MTKRSKEDKGMRSGSSSSSSSSSSSIHPEEEETYGFLTYGDDVGLVEIKALKTLMPIVKTDVTAGDKRLTDQGDREDDHKKGQLKDRQEDHEDPETDDQRDDSKDFMPDQDVWDLQSMPSLATDKEVHDISYLFNDSIEMMYLAQPVNESQILTLDTSESSVTNNDPEESMFANCNCIQNTSRDLIDDDDEEEEMGEVDYLYIPEV